MIGFPDYFSNNFPPINETKILEHETLNVIVSLKKKKKNIILCLIAERNFILIVRNK